MSRDFIGVIAGRSGNAITKELHKSGYKAALVCGRENEAGADCADNVLVSDLTDKEKIKNFLLERGAKYVILGTGHRFAIELGEYLEKNGFLLNVELSAVRLCKNKFLTNKRLNEAGLVTPNDILLKKDEFSDEKLDKALNQAGLPCVLKSINDIKEPQLLNDRVVIKKKIKELFTLEDEIMLESHVKGSDCTVIVSNDGLTIKALGCVYWSKGKSDRLIGFENARSYKLSAETEEKVLTAAKKAIEAVNVKGVSRTDFVVNDNGEPYILEVNSIIVSGLSGTTYCTKVMQKRINRARLIVAAALNMFGLPNNRIPVIGVFCEISCEITEVDGARVECVVWKKIEHIDCSLLLPDLEAEFLGYVEENADDLFGRKLSTHEQGELLNLLMYVIRSGYDYIENKLSENNKKMLKMVTSYLNSEEI